MAAGNARTMDPPFAGAFMLEVGGVTIGAFTEVSPGCRCRWRSRRSPRAATTSPRIKVPGRLKWPNLVLKRGITDNNSLFEWMAKCSGEGFEKEQRKVTRQTGSIALLDAIGRTVRQWKFRDAMPVRWTGPSFAAVRERAGHGGAGGEPRWLQQLTGWCAALGRLWRRLIGPSRTAAGRGVRARPGRRAPVWPSSLVGAPPAAAPASLLRMRAGLGARSRRGSGARIHPEPVERQGRCAPRPGMGLSSGSEDGLSSAWCARR